MVFSATKGVTSTVIHRLADRGLIDYDAPVAEYWREFGANGKAQITVRDVMRHRAGLSNLRGVRRDELLDHHHMEERIAAAPVDRHFGKHPKDGNFSIPDPRVIESLTDFMKVIARNPGGAALFSNLADMFLGNMSYYTTGFIQNMLTGFSKMNRRYIGKDTKGFNIHGLNLHPEDENDAALY